MENFVYSIPTKVYFGKGQIKNLGKAAGEYGKNVLFVYGGGSIKKNGLYDEVRKQLSDFNVTELSGVTPNPKIESAREGVKLCHENNIDVIVAVGGGSTTDCSKLIGAGYYYDGDPWDLMLDPSKIGKVLPIICVVTIAATGTEMDNSAVISNMETNDKIDIVCDAMKPAVAIMDPEYTFSVSKRQTAAGTADIISHICENYFNNVPTAYVQSGFAEALLRTCFKYGKVAYEDPTNYEARANLMWAASLALNGIIMYGCEVTWCVHPIEHVLSAYYDITHGAGLAILTPKWMEYVLSDKTVDRFAQYGVNVWDIDPSLDKFEIAHMAIDKTAQYFKDLNLPTTLGEVGIGEEKLEIMAEKAAAVGLENAYVPLNADDILKIYRACL